MRRAVVGVFAAGVCGCNQFWGIEPSVLNAPDAMDADPEGPRVQLTLQVAKTNPDNGYAEQTLELAPFEQPFTVRLGLLGEPLESATYEPDGTVRFPANYLGTMWRLAYAIGGIPYEVQWSPGDRGGHAVEPLFGRQWRNPVPAGSGYRIAATGPGAPPAHPRVKVFTTGLWTASDYFVGGAATVDYDYAARAKSLDGPLGAPEAAKHDHAVLADFALLGNINQCRVASGTATFPVPDLAAGTMAAPAAPPAYVAANKGVEVDFPISIQAATHGRMGTMLGAVANANADEHLLRWSYGYTPSLLAFGFTRPGDETGAGFLLPGPNLVELVECAFRRPQMLLTIPSYSDPIELRDRFPRAVHFEMAYVRTVPAQGAFPGIELLYGLASVVSSANDKFTLDFSVAAPQRAWLERGGAMVANLATDPEGTLLPAGDGKLDLVFEVEADPNLQTDHYDVIVHAIPAGRLDPVTVYTTRERRVALDLSVLQKDTRHVIEIRAYRGRPDAARANFAPNSYPQAAAFAFTQTFQSRP